MQPLIVSPIDKSENNQLSVVVNNNTLISSSKAFIEANSQPVTILELKEEHIIPVYINNEPLISHFDFISLAGSAGQTDHRSPV